MNDDDQITDIFDDDWNAEVDAFPGGDTDEEFQSNLRQMVRNLQQRAFERGWESRKVDDDTDVIRASLSIDESRHLLSALLNNKPMVIEVRPFDIL